MKIASSWWKSALIVSVVGACLIVPLAAAQTGPAAATRSEELRELAEALRTRDVQDRRQVRAYAQGIGLSVRRELEDGTVLELQRFGADGRPVFYITTNVDAADTVSTDEVYPGGSAGLALDGGGMVVGEWDGGAILAEHPEFIGRLTQVDGAATVSNHSTHVAGTLMAAGNPQPDARGMAYAAHLNAYDWNSDTSEMATAAANLLLISNHSYGIAAGWIYIGGAPPDTWWWIGGPDPDDVEDPNFGYYDAETQLWDQIAFDAPYYLPVKAAGNDRSDIGPAPGEEYTVIDQDGNPLFTSTLPREPDCAPAGYDCLPTTSVAKNVLTVGAVDDIPGGYSDLQGPSAVQMTDFSSWGPTDDGRIKPDLVGNGVFLFSTWGEDPYYAFGLGTSMSAPNVTGSLLLLQEHYQDLNGPGQFMRASTLKGLAIHTADEAGNADGPDYASGWGLLNTKSAAEVISGDGTGHQIIEGVLADGAVDSYQFTISGSDARLRATLVWTDPPGTPPAPSLDPPDLMLVNDLDLRVTRGAATYLPWVLDPSNPAAAATTGDNFRDNVEQVVVNPAGTGTYTIRVSHKGTLLNGQSQAYSLIISEETSPPLTSSFLIDEDFSGGLPAGWSIVTLRGIDWAIVAPVPGDPRLDNGTGGSGNFAIVDNNYSNQTVTHLRTHLMDLTTYTDAILRFKSYYYYDTFESLNVDASTDGGSSWVNVWRFQGFNPFPTQYVLDLSGAIAGHANVMLRFHFNSEGFISGDFWQVDDVELEVFGGSPAGDPPGAASNPTPADGASGVLVDADLGWSAGSGATSHDVYFGTANPPGDPEYQGNQAATSFDPGTLAYATTYYWRIDEVNADGTTAGPTWSFTTEAAPAGDPPGPASSPIPADGATGVLVDADLSWSADPDATSHDVYFGTTNPLGGSDFQGNQATTSFDPGTLAYATTYYWRIDEVNANGTTAGTTWSFTTEAAPALETVHLADLTGSPIAADRGRWTAEVQISVADESGLPESGVTVDGTWSNGANGSASCVTSAGGGCSVQKGNLKNNVDSVTFTVTGLSKSGFSYEPADNLVADSITVNREAEPPSGGGGLTVSARPFKVKGVQHVEVTWENFAGSTVDISRDGNPLPDSPTANDGQYEDNLGVKGGGNTYVYEVCETGTSNCASASASF